MQSKLWVAQTERDNKRLEFVAGVICMTASELELRHGAFFVQKVAVGDELLGKDRFDIFRQICQGKRVLHVGCVDWPITDLQTNLHVYLDRHCASLDGFDVNYDAFEKMLPLLRGRLFSRWEEVKDPYDVVLVPEVMEHVPNVAEFLRQIDAIRASNIVITVPDASQCAKEHFGYDEATKTFVEIVHPDHNCWYTPYTLQNSIRKHTNWNIEGIWFFNRISLLMIASKGNR